MVKASFSSLFRPKFFYVVKCGVYNNMTKKDLIDLIEDVPDDAEIVVAGFEGGFSSVNHITYPFPINLNVNKENWLEGPHQEADLNNCESQVLLIGDRRR